jgi:hypothetical protein
MMGIASRDAFHTRSLRLALAVAAGLAAWLSLGASSAVASEPCLPEPGPHPCLFSFGRSTTEAFSNPNGIAVDESTGDVYVADIAADTVYKLSASGEPVDFTAGAAAGSNALTGLDTPTKAFSFPNVYGTPAQIAVDNSTDPSDPSRGDVYVMDLGHDVIDKFNADGEYIAQLTGPFDEGPTGLAVTADGDVVVGVRYFNSVTGPLSSHGLSERVALFDNATANNFLKSDVEYGGGQSNIETSAAPPEHSFAVGPTGAYYMLFECGCIEKFGGGSIFLVQLGKLDEGPGDVAMAVDPVSGHLYVDDQSKVVEWDTGGMDGLERAAHSSDQGAATGALVSEFGSLALSGTSTQEGGVAVNGTNGEIYVSNPSDGKVYVFASSTPAVAPGVAANVTQTGATLQGSIDPRGVHVNSCEFEYEKASPPDELGASSLTTPVTRFRHSVSCAQTGQIGSGTSPVGVSAEIGGLEAGMLYYYRLTTGNADGEGASEGMFATKSKGFGIKEFSVSFLNREGTPDTQAGSHPEKMVVSFAFNTQVDRIIPNVESAYVLRPAGAVKDVIFDAPPGLSGNPNATEARCTVAELGVGGAGEAGGAVCSLGSQVGELYVETRSYGMGDYPLFNMVTPHGVAAQFGTHVIFPNSYINAGIQAGGQYPVQSESLDIPAIEPLYRLTTTLFGVLGSGESRKPFLTLPTGCTGPLRSMIKVDSYEEPGEYVEKEAITRNAAGEPVRLTGCSKLKFPPAISVAPDVSDASSSSGLTVGVHVPQSAAFNPEGLAESALRDTTVALPAGVSINPAGADGLEACSENLAGFEKFQEFNKEFEPGVQWAEFTPNTIGSLAPGVSFCPNGSKIGTVKIKTYLLNHELEGAVYLAAQEANPFGSVLAMYMLVEDPVSASTVKLTGEVRLCESAGQTVDGVMCQGRGQIITTFQNTPDLPFEELELHFFGGERAPLATPTRCGNYTTTAIFTPWDGNSPVTSVSSFAIEHGPNGGPCPGATLPFAPTVNAGATNIQAGAFSPLTVTVNRQDGEQNLKSLEAKLPPGLSGVLSGVELCTEPLANEGLCGEGSKVGEATVGVGVGNDPFTVTGGKFYLTGPYNGHGGCTVGETGCAPFGLTFEVPAKAGPFDLADTMNNHPRCDCVLVRGKIELNPQTAAITITSDPPGSPDSIPTSIEGIPLEIQHVNATTTRGDFQFNPTNCEKMALVGTVQLSEGGSSTITTPFQVTNCAALKFEPKFSVSTSAKTSRASGASLTAKLTYPSVPQGTDADISHVKVELPKQLPSRLTTLQKACTAAQFEANPAACPAASKIGYAVVHTPLIPVPLQGPAIFVSHGGEAFPSLTLVLQGYGITIDLVGTTGIKNGVTSTTFKTVPDQPFSSFELTLPEGPYSALTTAGNLCTAKNLTMPTEFVAQNGAELKQSTKIAVTGCPKTKKTTHKKTTHKKKHKTKNKTKRKPKR